MVHLKKISNYNQSKARLHTLLCVVLGHEKLFSAVSQHYITDQKITLLLLRSQSKTNSLQFFFSKMNA